jgi:hypothetical protein
MTEHTARAMAMTVLGATAYWMTYALVYSIKHSSQLPAWEAVEPATKVLASIGTIVGTVSGVLAIKAKLKGTASAEDK